MKTKAFVFLMVAVLVLGGSIGGAFAGGMALGQQRGKEQAEQGLRSAQGTTGQLSGQSGRQFQSGERPGAGALPGRGGLTGTIEKVEDNTVTVNTPQGPLQARIGPDTAIQKLAEGSVEDLQAGLRVTITGQPGEDGMVEASSILLTPEGDGGFSGGEYFRQAGQ